MQGVYYVGVEVFVCLCLYLFEVVGVDVSVGDCQNVCVEWNVFVCEFVGFVLVVLVFVVVMNGFLCFGEMWYVLQEIGFDEGVFLFVVNFVEVVQGGGEL